MREDFAFFIVIHGMPLSIEFFTNKFVLRQMQYSNGLMKFTGPTPLPHPEAAGLLYQGNSLLKAQL